MAAAKKRSQTKKFACARARTFKRLAAALRLLLASERALKILPFRYRAIALILDSIFLFCLFARTNRNYDRPSPLLNYKTVQRLATFCIRETAKGRLQEAKAAAALI